MKTWVTACKNSAAAAKILIPKGTFLVGPVVFQGPCKSSEPIVIEVQGTVKATTDISEYSSPEWISFERINGLVIIGGGTFDGQGPKVWQYNDCKTNPDCQHLAASFKFYQVNHAIVEGITSLNSKWFHFFTYNSKNFTFNNVFITAPNDSPNTDGIHLSSTSSVKISNTVIETGDDCIAMVQDTHDILVTNVTCGPGHGISVGSLGKWPYDKGCTGILVQNCTLRNTTNGARIKTWSGPTSGEASNIVYENIIMNNVKNPIIIDQNYGKYKSKPSKWKLSDIHFKNIKGTSVSKVSVSLGCSSLFPCEDVEMVDIDLTYSGAKFKTKTTDSVCANAKVKHSGLQNPVPCSGSGKIETEE
ncbi:Glycoside hydrolase [Parasponia andersonii]|uniref:Glycoside hydrolase n=1 Tax=Parasponia andersonii TaxID=3476 RepID=A0A2P5CXS3_PARAD|nr:Glycoside hydrolase [Parasponia andersonii]